MEAREITIVSTSAQNKVVIISEATTLGELKKDLDKVGVSYTNMTFYEGISKTELKDDASILPHDIPYKGEITNKLAFMLTNTEKKIKSGAMSRAEVFSAIKSNNLQSTVQAKYGKNYTQCKTDELLAVINGMPTAQPQIVASISIPAAHNCSCEDAQARKAIKLLANALFEEENITFSTYREVVETINGEDEVEAYASEPVISPYSDDELSSLFAGLN